MQTVFNLIMDTLKEANIAPVYALGAYEGSIDGKLIIVKPENATQYLYYSTTIQYYGIICYGRSVSEAVSLLDDVERAMKKLRFTVMPTHRIDQPFWNSTTHGWQVSCSYRNFIKNE